LIRQIFKVIICIKDPPLNGPRIGHQVRAVPGQFSLCPFSENFHEALRRVIDKDDDVGAFEGCPAADFYAWR